MNAKCQSCPVGPENPCIAAEWPERHANLCVSARSGDPVLVRHVVAVSVVNQGRPIPITSPVVPAQEVAPQVPLAGDLVASLTHRIGADRLAKWIAAKLGSDCRCAERQAKLNALDAKLRDYLRAKPEPPR